MAWRAAARPRAVRDLWPNAVFVVRYGREREQIAADIDAGFADVGYTDYPTLPRG